MKTIVHFLLTSINFTCYSPVGLDAGTLSSALAGHGRHGRRAGFDGPLGGWTAAWSRRPGACLRTDARSSRGAASVLGTEVVAGDLREIADVESWARPPGRPHTGRADDGTAPLPRWRAWNRTCPPQRDRGTRRGETAGQASRLWLAETGWSANRASRAGPPAHHPASGQLQRQRSVPDQSRGVEDMQRTRSRLRWCTLSKLWCARKLLVTALGRTHITGQSETANRCSRSTVWAADSALCGYEGICDLGPRVTLWYQQRASPVCPA